MYQYHVSVLDTDLYKFTQQQAYLFKYPRIRGRYGLIVRDNREFPDGFAKELQKIVDTFRGITLKREEKDFLIKKCYYLTPPYLDFLEGYRYDPENEVTIIQKGNRVEVIVEGYLYRTTLWEVPLMATISELYFQMTGQTPTISVTDITRVKAESLADIDAFYSEFGTRRRFSYEVHKLVVETLIQYGRGHLLGTSNVHFAMINDIIPMGTIAHEWYMVHAALFGYGMANQLATDAWVDVYKGDLGTALPDTFTTDVFLKTFTTLHAKLHDGLRQDSYDPLVFLDKAEAKYKSLRVNPMTKMILFSDNLNSIEKVARIRNASKGRFIDRYGIGTWFSNDVGVKAMNMVIKLMAVNAGQGWHNTIKLSDDLMKNMGNGEELLLCKKALGIA